MYELRVVALSEDARYLVLAPALEGRRERYRVPVDDRLRAALRGELGRLERKSRPDSSLSPREIQTRLRAGQNAESIAETAGVPVEWVLRFEAPVLAERGLVAEQARRATLSVTGGEWTGVPLGEVVDARLEADGIDPAAARWDAWRREDARWVVEVTCGGIQAQWLWDPALQRLTVHDEAARTLLHPPTAGRDEQPAGRVLVLGAPRGDADRSPTPRPEAADPAAGDEPAPSRPRRARRAAVPSWEDILLGTGTGPGDPTG